MSPPPLFLDHRRHLLLLFCASLLLSFLSALYVDQRVSVYFNSESVMPFRRFCRAITDVGMASHYFILSAVVFLLCWGYRKFLGKDFSVRNNPQDCLQQRPNGCPQQRLQQWSVRLFLSLCTSGIVVQLLKNIIGRQRPHVSPDFDPYVFHFLLLPWPVEKPWHFNSMPSGHSQVLFCVATIMALTFPKFKWIFFLLAAMISFTRVVTHNHFVSDCIIGAFLGFAVTVWTCKRKVTNLNA